MFIELQKRIKQKANELFENNKVLYLLDTDKKRVWEAYINSFEDEEFRQEHNCNCCKSFMRQAGGLVAINSKGQIESIWDIDLDDLDEYAETVKSIQKYLKKLLVKDIFLNDTARVGVEKNVSNKDVIWDHLFLDVKRSFVKPKTNIPTLKAEARSSKETLQRSFDAITVDAVKTALELIAQKSIYRGNESKPALEAFENAQREYLKIKNIRQKDAYCWFSSQKVGAAISRIKNSAFGTFLLDISEGKDLELSLRAYERMVAPYNYKRPKAIVTPKMVNEAKKKLADLGLTHCLNRRQLTTDDLNVNNSLYVDRAFKGIDVFDEIIEDSLVNPKSLKKVEEVDVETFVKDILPHSSSIKALVENRHFNNFVSLVGSNEESEKTLFKWNNNFSWSYTGEVADSIKEKVKKAGGNVNGIFRISLSWHSHDDLDLHLLCPNERVNFQHKYGKCGARLDVDMNAGSFLNLAPVENIFWEAAPHAEGKYKVIVNNYTKRDVGQDGYEVEIENKEASEIFNFSSGTNPRHKGNHVIVEFTYSKTDGFKVLTENSGNIYSQEKWGVKTATWTKVNAITLSPNFWQNETGNKHYFFFLENCIPDEKVRSFYNEFLNDDLNRNHKRVFEVLGNKMELKEVNNPLAGIGFSETIPNEIFLQVEGNFKRTIKLKIK